MKSIKRLLAIVMIVALIVSCFAVSTIAKDPFLITLYSDGTIYCTGSSGNDATYAKDTYGISWDSTQKAWVFDDTTITEQDMTDANKIYAILFRGDCTAVVNGECNIFAPEVGITSYPIYGDEEPYPIEEDAGLLIKGDGKLILSTNQGPEEKFGIICEGKLNIEDITLEITAGDYAICDFYDDVTIKDADVTIIPLSKNTYGIVGSEGNVNINGDSKLTMDGGNIAVGIEGPGEIYIEDNARLEIKSTSYCLLAKTVEISGNSIVNATIEDDEDDDGMAIGAKDIIFKNAVKVNANSIGDGIAAWGTLTFDLEYGGSVQSNAKAALIYTTLDIKSGTVILPANYKVIDYTIDDLDVKAIANEDETVAESVVVELIPTQYSCTNASWTQGSEEGQSITSEAEIDDFICVEVDSEIVDEANFVVTEGSTIVTFNPEYLATLSVGDHTVVINSKYGYAIGTLTIKEADPEEEPEEEPYEEPTEEPTEEPAEEPVEEPTEEPTEEPVEEPDDEIADTADTTVVSTFVALGTLSAAGYVVLKKKED